MIEQDFRQALHGVLTDSTPPPPMSSAAMLRAARRAQNRRRFAWTGGGSVAVAAVLAGLLSGGPAALTAGSPTPSLYPTRPPATGLRDSQGVRLLDTLRAAVPAGYTVVSGYHGAHQTDGNVWEYSATATIRRDGRTGMLSALVYTAGNTYTGDPCDLSRRFWASGRYCQVVPVGTAQVGVAAAADPVIALDQWAVYRQPDGVVVCITQSMAGDQQAPLTRLPLNAEQLAGLATGEPFHLS